MYQVKLILLSTVELRTSNSPLEKYSLTSNINHCAKSIIKQLHLLRNIISTEVVKCWSDRLSHSQSHLCMSAWTFKYHKSTVKECRHWKATGKVRYISTVIQVYRNSTRCHELLQTVWYTASTETRQDMCKINEGHRKLMKPAKRPENGY